MDNREIMHQIYKERVKEILCQAFYYYGDHLDQCKKENLEGMDIGQWVDYFVETKCDSAVEGGFIDEY
jgi:hypothetical protein